ncbi:MAG TPA: hypothetical protein VNP20_11380 [Nocardioidaceae bacterium]|nr:hypothetical protein [Nocardioidaceae bacterium]
MSAAWDRVRRRHRLVESALDLVRVGGVDELAAMDAQIRAEYAEEGFDGFLRDVQRRWHRAFDARLDGVLESGVADTRAAVLMLWQHLAQTHPQTRLVLDAYADHPALQPAERRHGDMLQAATGVDLAALPPVRRASRERWRPSCPLASARRRLARRQDSRARIA